MAIRTHIGAGARRYGALVGLPVARWPLVFFVAGSMPIGMYGLAILLLVRESNGSFAVAGRVVGAFGLANALGAVVQGRLMDRLGQSRVLQCAAAVHVAMLVALVLAAGQGAPAWALALCALGAGGVLPPAPGAARPGGGALLDDEDQRQTAY